MKTALEKSQQLREEQSGMNFIVSKELDKDSQKVLFPEKLAKAIQIIARLKPPRMAKEDFSDEYNRDIRKDEKEMAEGRVISQDYIEKESESW
jgi:hypothetical protein